MAAATNPPQTRRTPVQARSKKTIGKILAAATAILEESGLPGLNTNAVAQRAGVNVATLYSYFPDKNAILHTLAERFDEKRTEYVEISAEELATTEDWRRWFEQIIDQMVDFRLNEPAGIALRRAFFGSTELYELDRASSARSARAIASALRAHTARLDSARATAIAEVLTESITAVLDTAISGHGCDTGKVDELKKFVTAYLARYLDDVD